MEVHMARKTLAVLALVLAAGFASTAWADCVYQGKKYPTGTKIGGLTCQPDGTWR
ncbi:MAG: hypothetical protein JNL87_07740 [Burkholderiaceae bacterium]|nr:hypothetical protein [Burkholderiaceae bacterium]